MARSKLPFKSTDLRRALTESLKAGLTPKSIRVGQSGCTIDFAPVSEDSPLPTDDRAEQNRWDEVLSDGDH
jgi:hypothetical protein